MKVTPFGLWRSPLDLKRLFERPSPPMFPGIYRGRVYWLEARPREGGRLVLIRQEADGSESCLTPEGFNIRTRVHEYGGQCHVLANGHVYFSNYADQRLYCQPLRTGARPRPLTPERNADGSLGMYADLQATATGLLVFVYERDYDGRENVNTVACLPLPCGEGAAAVREPIVLAGGHDFYANPVLSGGRLAWLQWDHPHMPWDRSEVMVAALDQSGDWPRLRNGCVVAGGDDSSVCQLCYGADGRLYFAMDKDGEPPDDYWNLHVYEDGTVRRITGDEAEYGAPYWTFGDCRCVRIGRGRLVAVRTGARGDELVEVEVDSAKTTPIACGFTSFSQIAAIGGEEVLGVAAGPTETAKLIRLDTTSHKVCVIKEDEDLLDKADISIAEPIYYPTRDGGHAHAYFYPPVNAACMAPVGARPPLLVIVHGGPTARAGPALALHRQYWTTRGFALLDVNHRGSTGYGRRYRQALLGQWGELDVDDVADGIRYLIDQGRVDPDRICIRGGSAGGYMVLRALTCFPELFAVGACYYGIGNLAALARTTHKFEARYLDGLLGKAFEEGDARDAGSVYYRRSPIHHLHRLQSPMILFQGLDDKVVPPELSREMAGRLREKGIRHEYVEYPGEGHGFRRSENRIDALEREAKFYAEILSFTGG